MITRAFAQNLAVLGMLATLREVKRIALFSYKGTHVPNGNWWQLHDIAMMLMTGRWADRDYTEVGTPKLPRTEPEATPSDAQSPEPSKPSEGL